jgi:hypothetical protein
MSHLPGRDHDMDAARRRARVDAGAAFEATGAAVGSTERDPMTGKAAAWLASLPAPVQVHRLLEHAPDIADQLAASWSDVPTTTLLLGQLLIEGGPQSMSPMIASELLRLFEYQTRCRTTDAPDATWELPASGPQDLQPGATLRMGHP